MTHLRNSLLVQWLGLCTFTAKGLGSIPGQGPNIPQAMFCGQKKKKKPTKIQKQKTGLDLAASSLLLPKPAPPTVMLVLVNPEGNQP